MERWKENRRILNNVGLVKDHSMKIFCPRTSYTLLTNFSIEENSDPLNHPPQHLKNEFREFPCKTCINSRSNGEYDEDEGSWYEFKCVFYGGRVIELGIPVSEK